MPDDKFADSGEFDGMGVAGSVEEPDVAESAEPGAEPGAETGEDAAEAQDPKAEAEAPKEEASPETDGEPAEQGKASEPDPLDIPIEKFDDVDLGLGEAPVDKAVMAAFGEECVKLKLTPRQAAGLAQFQLAAIEKARTELTNETLKQLQKEWGKDAGQNQQAIIALVDKVDAQIGGGFRQVLEESGASCYAELGRALLCISEMLGEDALGPTTSTQGGGKESALDGLKAVFGAAKR